MVPAPTASLSHAPAPDGTQIAYRDEGRGMPVLCLSGLTRTMADFDYLIPHLPPCRLIRMDYRGRGGSGWSGAASYTVPTEAQDVLALLDHLGIDRVALIGTSRGGLVGLTLAVAARHRLRGLLFNDVGPVLEPAGLARIRDYVGRNPAARTHAEMAALLPLVSPGFAGVPPERWLEEARKHWRETPEGLRITYDPALRNAFLAAAEAPAVDLWPFFDACAGMPVALIRGAGSDLMSAATADEMARRRSDLIRADVPGRGHVPFLDEPESLAAVRAFLEACA